MQLVAFTCENQPECNSWWWMSRCLANEFSFFRIIFCKCDIPKFHDFWPSRNTYANFGFSPNTGFGNARTTNVNSIIRFVNVFNQKSRSASRIFFIVFNLKMQKCVLSSVLNLFQTLENIIYQLFIAEPIDLWCWIDRNFTSN